MISGDHSAARRAQQRSGLVTDRPGNRGGGHPVRSPPGSNLHCRSESVTTRQPVAPASEHVGGWLRYGVAPLVRSSRPAASTNPSHEQVSSSSPHLLPSARDHAGGETAAAPHPRLRRCRRRGGDRPRSPRPRHPQQPQREVRRKTRRSPGTLATSVGEDRATA